MAQCEFCGRCFARNEHLTRHQRIHTGERPFHCPHCRAGFQRPDVLAKHIQKLHRREGSAGDTSPQRPNERQHKPKDRERSRLACDQCRKRKLKCNNVRPCGSCQSKLLTCTVSSSSRPPGRPRNIVPVSPTENYTATDPSPTREDETSEGLEAAPLLEPWTPNSIEPLPAPVGRQHSSEPTNIPISTSDPRAPSDAYFGPTGLQITDADEWVSAVPSVQPSFATGAMHLQPTCEMIDFLEDLVPSADFGTWLEDLNEFSSVYDFWPQTSTAIEVEVDFDPSMESAVDMMKDQLQRRSRASSPSREAQRWSWYSALPQLGVYDEEIINILLNVSKMHIASTFAIFADFEAGEETRVELCLAMAAVGGLYCTVPDSTKIAKMLFNDSRRLMLEDYLQHSCPSFGEYLSIAKTFILLEIYGLCSGDKRAYEFMEVFHGSKVHAASSCINVLPQEATMSQRRQALLLSEAMRVLDCYRVLLLQRPPSFTGGSGLQKETSEFQFLPAGGIVLAFTSSGSICSSNGDMHTLATIIRYSWMASPRDADSSPLPRLWKAEFVELALDRWIQAKTTDPDPQVPREVPQMLLYYLTQISLQSNMGILQRLTQAAAQSASPSQRNEILDDIVQPWATNRHFEIALWHAKAILRMAHEGMAPPRRNILFEKGIAQFFEPPHLPLCIYFATLIVWFGEVKAGRGDTCSGDHSIEAGSQLLFKLKVPVAKFLGTALCELLSTEDC
ncbi:Fc.00g000200.m01.CDS01 [Cosmosporella sp. VM-42]